MKFPDGIAVSPDGTNVQRIEVAFEGPENGGGWAVLPLDDLVRYKHVAQVVGMVAFRLNGLRGVVLDAHAVGAGLLTAWVGDPGTEMSRVLEQMGAPVVASGSLQEPGAVGAGSCWLAGPPRAAWRAPEASGGHPPQGGGGGGGQVPSVGVSPAVESYPERATQKGPEAP